jgi:UPF0176 protein
MSSEGKSARRELAKIILFYAFTPISDPEAIRLWQRDLCESLDLKGRILISKDGINGTLGGSMSALKRYVRKTREFEGFKGIDFKWSDGTGSDFPRLSVKVRAELVTFGRPTDVKVDESGVIGGGKHLKPEEVNQLVAERGDVVFFDGRNAFEAKIGRFKDAVVPETSTTRDFIAELESGKYDHLKGKPIVTYCTGGIRCEVLSALMKERGFAEVYQIEGGIVRYGEKFGSKGLWEGSLYTFDARMRIEFDEETKVIGKCDICGAATRDFVNCIDPSCHEQLLLCESCVADPIKRSCPTLHRPQVRTQSRTQSQTPVRNVHDARELIG